MSPLFESRWKIAAAGLEKGGCSYKEIMLCKGVFYLGAQTLGELSTVITDSIKKGEVSEEAGFEILSSLMMEVKAGG